MTWTSAVGKYCGWLLYKIVDGLALARISPNVLTFMGLVINTIAAILFGVASSDNDQAFLFRCAGWVIFGAGIFDMVDGRVARETTISADAQVSVLGLPPGLYTLRATNAQGRPVLGRVLVQ